MTHCHCQGHQWQPKGQYQVSYHLGWFLECSEYLVIKLVFQTFGFFLSIPVPSCNSNFIILHLEKIHAKFQNFWNFVLLRNLLQQYVGVSFGLLCNKNSWRGSIGLFDCRQVQNLQINAEQAGSLENSWTGVTAAGYRLFLFPPENFRFALKASQLVGWGPGNIIKTVNINWIYITPWTSHLDWGLIG